MRSRNFAGAYCSIAVGCSSTCPSASMIRYRRGHESSRVVQPRHRDDQDAMTRSLVPVSVACASRLTPAAAAPPPSPPRGAPDAGSTSRATARSASPRGSSGAAGSRGRGRCRRAGAARRRWRSGRPRRPSTWRPRRPRAAGWPSARRQAACHVVQRMPSTQMNASAARCATAWNVASGLPNCLRLVVYSAVMRRARSATPVAMAQRPATARCSSPVDDRRRRRPDRRARRRRRPSRRSASSRTAARRWWSPAARGARRCALGSTRNTPTDVVAGARRHQHARGEVRRGHAASSRRRGASWPPSRCAVARRPCRARPSRSRPAPR